MKKKQIIALLCATTMTLSTSPVAFAADGDPVTSVNSTGAGIIENDGSTAPSYSTITLPTIAASTYDFKLDPQGLLHEYNSKDYPDAGTMYFHAETAPTAIAIKDTYATSNSGAKLYTKSITKESGTAKLKNALTATSGAVSQINGNFYVWIPDSASQTKGGKHELLTTSNIAKYFDIDIDTDGTTINSVTAKADHLSEDVAVFDGEVYTDTYTEASNPTSIDNLYVSSNATTYTAIDDDNKDTILKITAAKDGYINTSDKATIENKSTVATTVTATVTVNNAEGLTFLGSNSFSGDADASVYLAITDGTTPTAVAKQDDDTVVATATFNLAAASSTTGNITYQKSATDSVTGGHVYDQYEPSDVTYDSKSFWLVGAANGEAGAKDAWDEYVAGLTADTRPAVDVVYTISNEIINPAPVVPEVPAVTDDYKIAVAADGTASYTFVTKPDTDATGITALSSDGSDRIGAVSAGNAEYNSETGVLSFKAPAVTNFVANASSITATINGEDFTFTVVDPYVITIADGLASLIFDSASKPSGSITALTINGTDDRMAAVTANNVTYEESTGTLAFKAPAVTNFLSTANTVEITIGSNSYVLRVK